MKGRVYLKHHGGKDSTFQMSPQKAKLGPTDGYDWDMYISTQYTEESSLKQPQNGI